MSCKQNLKICMLSDDFLPAATGVGIHLQCIVRALVKKGHSVTVVTSRRKGEPKIEVWEGATIYRTFTIRVYGFYQALPSKRSLKKILNDGEFDIIHYHYLSLLLIKAVKLASALELKQIYTYHMTVDHITQPPPLRPLRGFFTKLIVNYCNKFNAVIAPSAELATQVKASGVTTPTHYLSNPILFEEVTTNDSSPQPKNNKNIFTLLFVGRLNPEKNLPFLIEAFQKLKTSHPQTRLLIAGHGDQHKKLSELVTKYGLDDCITFLGFVPHSNLPALYQKADVFVLPSLIETQGIVAMEAMRFSLPIIVTSSIVSAIELVDEGKNGFIIDPDSTGDLADKLILLADNPKLRYEMGQNSLEKSGIYSPEKIITQLEEHYYQSLEE